MAHQPTGLPGIRCPECGAPLVINMPDVIRGQAVECGCGLTLRVDQERSQETLRDLRDLQHRLAALKERL